MIKLINWRTGRQLMAVISLLMVLLVLRLGKRQTAALTQKEITTF
jgi:hypothetical protein